MKRREFVQAMPLTALLPAGLAIQTGTARAESAPAGEAPAAAKAPGPAAPGGGSRSGAVPDFAEHMLKKTNRVIQRSLSPTIAK
jgi:hypothetical protein